MPPRSGVNLSLPDLDQPGLEPVAQCVGLVIVGQRLLGSCCKMLGEAAAFGVHRCAFSGEPDGGGVVDGAGRGLVDAVEPSEHGFGLAGDEAVEAVL